MKINCPIDNKRLTSSLNEQEFKDIALEIFQFQYKYNLTYKSFVNQLKIDIKKIKELNQIPFLPISFFKTHKIISGNFSTSNLSYFESSGTSKTTNSKHFIADINLYENSLINGFESVYGSTKNYRFLALLPSYLERKNASLVHMAKTLMSYSQHNEHGFFLQNWEELKNILTQSTSKKTILLGVTFALLDFANQFPIDLSNIIVMETGGMKGRREEWTRSQVHHFLAEKWNLKHVHSEYGMTELMSQAYAVEKGIFQPTPTMKVMCREMNDPLTTHEKGNGCLNIIDLSNIYSCSFLATEDLGTVYENGTFEVSGRMDNSALRGCSLLFV